MRLRLVLSTLALFGVVRSASAQAALEPVFASSRDSDGNLGYRLGLVADGPVGPGARLGLEAMRWQIEDGLDRVRSYELLGRGTFLPSQRVRIEAAAGATRVDLSGVAPTETVFPVGRFHARWRPGRFLIVDVRARRSVVDVSPDLLANHVIRGELGGTLDLLVAGPLKLRGLARTARLDDRLDHNARNALGAMVVLMASPLVEISGQFHRITFDHFSTAGYFAPRLVQVAQIGSYGEVEAGPFTAAYDVAAGAQRLAEQSTALGEWGRALSAWGQAGVKVTSGMELRAEVEFYDSPAAAIAAGSAGWTYGSARASVRWTF